MSTAPFLLWFSLLCVLSSAEDFYYSNYNVTRVTPNGIQAYRSALTLDWLAAEDSRQREMVAVFETEASAPPRVVNSECITYPRPSTGKVARLMLELLKNLEGDEGVIVPDLIQALIRSKLLVLETSIFDAEPDFEALVKTPNVMMGEPHSTFPRILAMVWMSVTNPTTKKGGWCTINKVTQYLSMTRSSDIAKNMRALDPIIARARFIMEEFIQHVTPLNIMQQKQDPQLQLQVKPKYRKPLLGERRHPKLKRPQIHIRTENLREPVDAAAKVQPQETTSSVKPSPSENAFADEVSLLDKTYTISSTIWSFILPLIIFVL